MARKSRSSWKSTLVGKHTCPLAEMKTCANCAKHACLCFLVNLLVSPTPHPELFHSWIPGFLGGKTFQGSSKLCLGAVMGLPL